MTIELPQDLSSILDTTKKLLGIPTEYEYFDNDIIVQINSAFSTLTQLGVGPKEGFYIVDSSAEWSDYISSVPLLMVKNYIYLKVRTVFDPPASSSVMDAMNRQISELEWRLNSEVDIHEKAGD